jgi:excisionase family DNA binding protein
MTPQQVAATLQFTSPKPIYRMISRGELPAAKIQGRLLIERKDVRALVKRSRIERKPARRGGLRELERGRRQQEDDR